MIAVSLENLTADVSELEKGIEATYRELEAARACSESVAVLEQFLVNAERQMNLLKDDCKKAQVTAVVLSVIHSYWQFDVWIIVMMFDNAERQMNLLKDDCKKAQVTAVVLSVIHSYWCCDVWFTVLMFDNAVPTLYKVNLSRRSGMLSLFLNKILTFLCKIQILLRCVLLYRYSCI